MGRCFRLKHAEMLVRVESRSMGWCRGEGEGPLAPTDHPRPRMESHLRRRHRRCYVFIRLSLENTGNPPPLPSLLPKTHTQKTRCSAWLAPLLLLWFPISSTPLVLQLEPTDIRQPGQRTGASAPPVLCPLGHGGFGE
jgi:hypothetical protein